MKLSPHFRFLTFELDTFGSYEIDWEKFGITGTPDSVTLDRDEDSAPTNNEPDQLLNALFGVGVSDDLLRIEGTPKQEGEFYVILGGVKGATTVSNERFGVLVTPKAEASTTTTQPVVDADCISLDYDLCIKQIVTSAATYDLLGNVTGKTPADLANNLNDYFTNQNLPLAALTNNGALRLITEDASTLTSVTLCDDSTLSFSTVQAPSASRANNEFFGTYPDDETGEYSFYTIIRTCDCNNE